jgi:hypothetical protein
MSLLTAGTTFTRDLARCQANDPSFSSLDWSENSIDAADAARLAAALEGNTHLQTLVVRYGIYMTNDAAARLEDALVKTCVVRAVVVGRSYAHNGRTVVRDTQVRHVAGLRRHCVANAARRAAADDPSLVEIDWSNTEADDEDIRQLAPALGANTQLQRISLSSNRAVTDHGASLLAAALSSSSVVRVDIDGCHRVGREAAAGLRRVWVANTCRRVKANDSTLAEIDWSNTEADDEDLCMLAAALPGSTSVSAITLAQNRLIGDAGATALQCVLQHCGVVVVAMDVTSVGEPRKAAIRRLCVANAARRVAADDRALTELDWRVMRRASVLQHLASPACLPASLPACLPASLPACLSDLFAYLTSL